MACQDGVIKVWTGEEWEKMACQGCENCLMDEDMPTKSLVERYAQQAALYAEGIKPTLHPDGSITDGPTSIHEALEAHTELTFQQQAQMAGERIVQGLREGIEHNTPGDTSETPTDAPGMPQMPQEVIDQGAQAMTEWVIKQTALAKKAMDKISKTMDTPRPVPNRADKRKRSREMQRYFNQQRNQ